MKIIMFLCTVVALVFWEHDCGFDTARAMFCDVLNCAIVCLCVDVGKDITAVAIVLELAVVLVATTSEKGGVIARQCGQVRQDGGRQAGREASQVGRLKGKQVG